MTEPNKHIRFNYPGDFHNLIDKEKINLSSLEFGLDSDKRNSLAVLIDIAVTIVNKKLKITY